MMKGLNWVRKGLNKISIEKHGEGVKLGEERVKVSKFLPYARVHCESAGKVTSPPLIRFVMEGARTYPDDQVVL